MKAIGLDIGTTSISAVLFDIETGNLLHVITADNDSVLTPDTTSNEPSQGGNLYEEHIQDPHIIRRICESIISDLTKVYDDISHIGITGQMHGILYVDVNGKAVSPLFTWQSQTGNCLYKDSLSYADYASKTCGYPISSGFGLCTYFYHSINNLVPLTANTFCTIGDYIAMSLTSSKRPLLHQSMAASLGLYDLEHHCFSKKACISLGLDYDFLPSIAVDDAYFAHTDNNQTVSLALGDSQSSFLASVGFSDACLINIGTGSQISTISKEPFSPMSKSSPIDYRPYINGYGLLTGAPLCGGYAYALLKDFYAEVLRLFSNSSGHVTSNFIYETMNKLAKEYYKKEQPPIVDPRFKGTRQQPTLTGSITGLTTANFHPGYLTYSMLQGICDELFQLYTEFTAETKENCYLVGSGNGLTNNSFLRELMTHRFNKPLRFTNTKEEAAYGAALFVLYSAGVLTPKNLDVFIKYS